MGVAGWVKMFVGIGILMLIIRNPGIMQRLVETFTGIITGVTHLGDTG